MSHAPLREALSELVALTELYLLQENEYKEWLFSDPETYQFFKVRAEKNRAAAPKAEEPKKEVKPPELQKQEMRSQVKPAETKLEEVKKESIHAEVKALEEVKKEPIRAEVKALEEVKKEPIRAEVKALEEVKKEPEQKEEIKKPFFSLEPLGAPKEVLLSDVRSAVSERLGQIKLSEAPPLPTLPPVVVLTLDETGEELLLIHNVASAIDRLLMHAEVITIGKNDLERDWKALVKRPGLKWIVLFGDASIRLPGIEKSSGGIVKIGSISLLLQPAAATLLRYPQQKAALWKLLKQLLS